MKKIKTSSYFVWIIETKKSKFIRQYKRNNKGFRGYPRTIPTCKTMKLLSNTGINLPKLLRNRIKYLDEEYIESTISIYDYNKKELIDTIINYENELYEIDYTKLKNYINWNNNSEFYLFLINHIYNNLDKFNSKTINILNELEINKDLLKKLKTEKIDNNRKLSYIHGDIKYENMIISNNELYLIDWELATIGDIAYEFATHFLLMNYSDEEQDYFLNEYCKNKKLDINSLKNDIYIYTKFELIRRCYLKLNQLIEKNNIKYLDEFYDNYSLLTKYINIKKRNKIEIKEVIEK